MQQPAQANNGNQQQARLSCWCLLQRTLRSQLALDIQLPASDAGFITSSLGVQQALASVDSNVQQLCSPLPTVCAYFLVSKASSEVVLPSAQVAAEAANAFPAARNASFKSVMQAAIVQQLLATDADAGDEHLQEAPALCPCRLVCCG